MPTTTIKQNWNTANYAATGRFVSTLGEAVLKLLAPQPGEHILDLGCGDGALTEELATAGAHVTGVDASVAMLEEARKRGLHVLQMTGEELTFEQQFDAVFSNAALHWMRDQQAVIAGVVRALKPGGRFVAEMGGMGNIAAIRVALQSVLTNYQVDAEETAQSYFPSVEQYTRLLVTAGLTVKYIELIPRPTPLPAGMAAWLETFRNGVLDQLAPADRAQAKEAILALLRSALCDEEGNWSADYVRLRFKAVLA